MASAAPSLRTTWLIGKFQGVNAATGPDRLLQHQLLRRQVARRHDAAVDAEAFVGEPFDDVGGGQRLALGFGQRLALFLRQQRGDVAGALAHQRRRPCA